jgi:predicted choloylglycine hydrolase
MSDARALLFRSVAESDPAEKWLAFFEGSWPAYRRWYLSPGDQDLPGYAVGRAKLRRHMPELAHCYERLCDLTRGEAHAAGFLALYRPPPFLSGCSQIAIREGRPMLVRNYDFDPRRCEGRLLLSRWHGMAVLAMTDCLWGALDGVNEAGLAASLAFGGRRIIGDGFGVPLILRYILEFCETTREVAATLARLPCHMAYNITLLDRSGDAATVMLAPDREALVTDRAIATNHQLKPDWPEHARFSRTLARERFLAARLRRGAVEESDLLAAFLEPPLYTTDYEEAFGTLYTAAYWPDEARLRLVWPDAELDQSTAAFTEGERYQSFKPSRISGRKKNKNQ